MIARALAVLTLASLLACSAATSDDAASSSTAAATVKKPAPRAGRPCLPEGYSIADPPVDGYTTAQLHEPCGGALRCSEYFVTHAFYCEDPSALGESFVCDRPDEPLPDDPRLCDPSLTCERFFGDDSRDNLHWACHAQ